MNAFSRDLHRSRQIASNSEKKNEKVKRKVNLADIQKGYPIKNAGDQFHNQEQ